jgi:hypothetical protein
MNSTGIFARLLNLFPSFGTAMILFLSWIILRLCVSVGNILLFIDQELKLAVHSTNNIIVPVCHGVHFLGCDIYPTGRRLRRRVLGKIKQRLNFSNISSYRALTVTHSKQSIVKWIDENVSFTDVN